MKLNWTTQIGAAALLILLAVSNAAAETINGAVTDAETGRPIVAAQINAIQTGTKNPEIKATVDTDLEGKFSLEGLPPGIYVITATFDGYRPASQKGVDAAAAAPATIGLKLSRSPY